MSFIKRVLPSNISGIGKRHFSCSYNEPVLFGPMFSSFFFVSIGTYSMIETVSSSHHILKKDLDDIKKEMKEKK